MGDAEGMTAQGRGFLNVVREGRSFSGRERHCLFLNNRDNEFIDVSALTGFDLPDDGRGLAQVDWDQDGDLDFWISNRNAPQIRFMENQQNSNRHFLLVKLTGVKSNRDAIGGRVRLFTTADAKPITRTVRAGDSFLAQSSKTLHFGLGEAAQIDRLEIQWPSGERQIIQDVSLDRLCSIREGDAMVNYAQDPGRQIAKGLETPVVLPADQTAQKTVCFSMVGFPATNYDASGMSRPFLDPSARMVLVNLWASWCKPCVDELQEFTSQALRLRQAKIDVVALSVDGIVGDQTGDQTTDPGQAFDRQILKKIGFPFRSGVADSALTTKLQMLNDTIFEIRDPLPIPTSFLLDRKRRVLVIYKGPITVDQLLSDVQQLRVKTTNEWRDASVPFAGHWMMPPRTRHLFDFVNELADHGFLAEAIEYVQRDVKMFRTHPRWNELRDKLSKALSADHERR